MPRKATRSAQGGGTIRQRANGLWEARYTVGRDPGTGKQIQRNIYGFLSKRSPPEAGPDHCLHQQRHLSDP